ncbi:hypothetical protein QBC37DRAFT_282330 [Rhypophila decipiens]|uniref:Uncharacterized protein n=1 Tax=Rhypophila decipiens TaxID=261697 RepID=A0AAN6YBY4_9PEZI|nr:hypothetical protein QBC37DRAFT_282330 [Rhypophila decipiens]
MANPETSTTQHDRPTLESLPSEMLHCILDYMMPEEPEIGETRPVNYSSLVPGEDWHSFLSHRRALWSLCLVSRKLASLAQGRLHKEVVIFTEESLVLFLRTLEDSSQLVQDTRSFSCRLTLSRPGVVRDVHRALNMHCDEEMRPLVDKSDDFRTYHELDRPEGHDRTPEAIVSYILLRLPRLETLLLQTPICDDHPDYGVLVHDLVYYRGQSGLTMLDPPETPFKHLKTLKLQGDPELGKYFEEESEDPPECWGVDPLHYMPLFWISSKLTTLEVSCDDGSWSFGNYEVRGSEHLGSLRHIYLHDSLTLPLKLGFILQHTHQLETLYMTPRDDPEEDDHHWEHMEHLNIKEGHDQSLDAALGKYGMNLRHLDIGWLDVPGHGALIGPNARLPSLTKLAKLEKLAIQLVVLYGRQVADPQLTLAGLLPPNLVELVLEDWWFTDVDDYEDQDHWGAEDRVSHYRRKRDYRTNALSTLLLFAEESITRQPKLEKLLLLCPIQWTWIAEEGISPDFPFEEVKQAFQRRGVEFIVDEA